MGTVALAAALLTGCAEATPTEAEPELEPVVLTKKQVDAAMLTLKDIGGRFRPKKPTSGDTAGGAGEGPGCLGRMDRLTAAAKAKAEAVTDFVPKSRVGMPIVTVSVATFADESRLAKLLDDLERGMKACRDVDVKVDGARWRLSITNDRLGWASDAEEQFNVRATGTISEGQLKIPLTIQLTIARIANNGVYTLMFDFRDNVALAPQKVTKATLARVRAVMLGERLPARRPLLKNYPIATPQELQEYARTSG